MKFTSLFIASVTVFLSFIAVAQIPQYKPSDIDLPYQQFELSNGLRLIVHEDSKAPIVAVNVWYHVGSKNEKEGRTGFAHLFEHLMFNGSENFNDDYFQALESIGATDLNGTTNTDRTNYFQNVPKAALDRVLWLESDRMGHLLGSIDQAKLDEQRGVVQNEKRQGENQPYGKLYTLMTESLWPEGHPYSWTVIGSMEDLDAAELNDVQEWFKTYYGTANAVIVVAGDIKANEVHEKVKKYFGNIPSGPTLARHEVNVPKRTANTRQVVQDRVPEGRIFRAFVSPQWGSKEAVHLSLASQILSSGKTSRMYKKLVYEDQTATSAYAYNSAMEIAGSFNFVVNVKPGNEVEKVEATLDAIISDFLQKGPTQEELNKVRAQYFANFISGSERIGGFGGKSDILAMNAVFGGTADYYKKTLDMVNNTTIDDIKKTCNKYLNDGSHTIVCRPFPSFNTTGVEADRTKMPDLGEVTAAAFPDIQKSVLNNGVEVYLAQRKNSPVIIMNMIFDAGYSTDKTSIPGIAALAMDMMDEGTKSMNALEISDKLQMLGASIGTYSDLDNSFVYLRTLKQSLIPSLAVYTDILLNPSFPDKEFERLKKQQLAGIEREKKSPTSMALRVIPKFIYEEGHPYNMPLTGSGYMNTVEKISKQDIQGFYNTWFKPNNAKLVVVGDIEMKEVVDQLNKALGSWKKGEVPQKKLYTMKPAQGGKLYLIDRPESQQSIIMAGYVTVPYGEISEISRGVMIDVLGGQFTSRINMNLREDKHWSYGASSFIWSAKGQRPFIAYAPVQSDKTKESIQELKKEIEQFIDKKPITQQEFDKVQKNNILELPGRWETNESVASSVAEIVKYNLSSDYYKNFDEKVKGTKISDIQTLSKKIIKPEQLTWFVVGDKDKIQGSLKELGFSEIVLIDADGNTMPSEAAPMGMK